MRASWHEVVDAAVALRRRLHRRPELAWHETATAAAIREGLDEAGIAWRPCAGTGTVATLAPTAPGRHVALRADIDAMPIHEGTGLAWASEVDGCMHACGHDGHTATLFAAGCWLRQHEADLPGPVTLLFQPAEEGGHGAKGMIEDGALEGVDVVYGWHNWPTIPFGKAVCPDGVVMAGNGTFRITVVGRGGHASQPESCRDPVLAASAIVLALQEIVSRRLPPQQAAVVSVTSLEAPSGPTVIPDRAVIGGSIRVGETGQRDLVNDLIAEIARDTARAYGTSAEVELFPRYAATVNHAPAAGELRDALAGELGSRWMSSDTLLPVMASEDFSYYLGEVPGAFALVGAGHLDGGDEPCHSPRYDFEDRLIPRLARVYVRLAGAPVPGRAGLDGEVEVTGRATGG